MVRSTLSSVAAEAMDGKKSVANAIRYTKRFNRRYIVK